MCRMVIFKHIHSNEGNPGTTKSAIIVSKNLSPKTFIISDVMMDTQTEGFHLAYKLRSLDARSEYAAYKDVPILMVTSIHETATARFDDAVGTEWLPVDEFIEKPIQPNQLLSIVNRMLGK